MTRFLILLLTSVALAQDCQPTNPQNTSTPQNPAAAQDTAAAQNPATRAPEVHPGILPNDPQEGTFGEAHEIDGFPDMSRPHEHPFTLLPGEEEPAQGDGGPCADPKGPKGTGSQVAKGPGAPSGIPVGSIDDDIDKRIKMAKDLAKLQPLGDAGTGAAKVTEQAGLAAKILGWVAEIVLWIF